MSGLEPRSLGANATLLPEQVLKPLASGWSQVTHYELSPLGLSFLICQGGADLAALWAPCQRPTASQAPGGPCPAGCVPLLLAPMLAACPGPCVPWRRTIIPGSLQEPTLGRGEGSTLASKNPGTLARSCGWQREADKWNKLGPHHFLADVPLNSRRPSEEGIAGCTSGGGGLCRVQGCF